jgi:hypothetical protein
MWLNDAEEYNSADNPLTSFMDAWKQLAPNTTPFAFTLTASDAIN